MKMELLHALLYRPEVLFLDEPTIGLDLVAQQRVRDFLRDLNQRHGTTILLTSHYMDDIEELCERVLVIDHGRKRYDGSLRDLVRSAAPHKTVRITFADPAPMPQAKRLCEEMGCTFAFEGETQARVTTARERVSDVAGMLLRQGDVIDIAIEEIPVEEIIRGIFAGAEVLP
jgi:ABC-2 type transport system ATP-binding protein